MRKRKTNTFVQKSLNCYNKQYFYHNSIIITLNLLRRDEKGIDGVRKKKQILLYRNHLTVTINNLAFMHRLLDIFALIFL